MSYSRIPTGTEEILKLIARTPTGRQVLARFIPLCRENRVRFEPYAPELLARLRAELGEGQPVGACFATDGASGSIHYDPSAPIGVLAAFLLHEMVHALDPALWAAGREGAGSRAERDRLMLEAEASAFELQHKFVNELRESDPEYDTFLRTQQARVRVLHEKLLAQDIHDLYGLVS